MGQKHHPSTAFNPKTDKNPRVAPVPADDKPAWRVGRIDFGGPWCPRVMDSEVLSAVVERLKGLEGMTWVEIGAGTKSHNVSVNDLIKEAKKRLEELRLDDLE